MPSVGNDLPTYQNTRPKGGMLGARSTGHEVRVRWLCLNQVRARFPVSRANGPATEPSIGCDPQPRY